MKIKQFAIVGMLSLALIISACGKKHVQTTDSSVSTSTGGTGIPTPPCPSCTNTSTSTNTTGGGGAPPYSYEFTKLGNQTFSTGNITTDNVLIVKFRVTPTQGNSVWQADELKTTITVNGTQVTPTYTDQNYVYGQVGETSNAMDLSSYITPGVPVVITVTNPMNNFYCTYPYYNPLYGQYPGCRKAVFSSHNWSGVLLVQTSATQAI